MADYTRFKQVLPNLPGLDGIAATRALAGRDTTRDIPVVAVSAAAMGKDVEKGLAAGFKAYLTKPFEVQEVIDTVDRILSEKDGTEQIEVSS